jgi:hypothetical protein
VPNVLFAAKCDHANCAGKMSGPATAFKGDSNGTRIISIFVDEQQGSMAVWAPNGIARIGGYESKLQTGGQAASGLHFLAVYLTLQIRNIRNFPAKRRSPFAAGWYVFCIRNLPW